MCCYVAAPFHEALKWHKNFSIGSKFNVFFLTSQMSQTFSSMTSFKASNKTEIVMLCF